MTPLLNRSRFLVPLVAFFAVIALLLSQPAGQTPVPSQLGQSRQTFPGPIPYSVLTDVITQDAYICGADFTGSYQGLLIQDRQPTPVPWINGTFAQQTSWIYSFPDDSRCRFMSGGISWKASATGVTGFLKIKCKDAPCAILSNPY